MPDPRVGQLVPGSGTLKHWSALKHPFSSEDGRRAASARCRVPQRRLCVGELRPEGAPAPPTCESNREGGATRLLCVGFYGGHPPPSSVGPRVGWTRAAAGSKNPELGCLLGLHLFPGRSTGAGCSFSWPGVSQGPVRSGPGGFGACPHKTNLLEACSLFDSLLSRTRSSYRTVRVGPAHSSPACVSPARRALWSTTRAPV